MKNNIDPLLIKDLYKKYASDVKVDDKRIKQIEETYGDNNKLFIQDFYKKYAPDKKLTYEKFSEISDVYGLKKKEGQSSPNSGDTSPQEPFDPIKNRVEKYNMEIEELINQDEVIQSRSQELQSQFKERIQKGEFESQEQAEKAYNLALMKDDKIKEREIEIARDVDNRFKEDLKAIEKIDQAREDLDKPSVSLSTLSNLNRRFYELAPDLLDATGIGAKFINNYVTAPLGIEDKVESIEDTPSGRLAKSLRSTIQEATPAADENTESKAVQIGGAIGQVLSYAATGGTGQAAKVANLEKALQTGKGATSAVKEVIKATNNRTSQIASSQMSTYGYKRALEEGATDGEAFASAFSSAMIGKTEALPIGKMFSRLNSSTNGIVKRILTGGFKGGAEELAQESLQTYLENLSAQQIYDSKTDLFDEVLEAGEIGGYTGMILNGLVSALAGRKAKAKNPQEKANLAEVENEALELKAQFEGKKIEAEQRAIEKAEQIENEQAPTEPNNTVDGENTTTPVENQQEDGSGEVESQQDQSQEGETNQSVQLDETREGETKITPSENKSIDESKNIAKNKDGSFTYKNSKNSYKVNVKDGELDIVDEKTGKKLEKKYKGGTKNNTYQTIRQEFEESFKYDQGKTTQELDQQALDEKNMSVTEAQTLEATNPDQFVAEFSENPAEIARRWDESRRNQKEGNTVDRKDSVIAKNIGKVKPENFNNQGDRNKINNSIAKSYFPSKSDKKKGKTPQPIDDLAAELSTEGLEITPQDIVDFMERYPNGPQQALNKRSEGQIALEDKFSELTGLPLDKHRADIVKAQDKANRIELESEGITPDNVDTYIDEFADRNYTEQDYAEWKRIKKEEAKQAGSSSRNTEVRTGDGSNQGQTPSKGEKSATKEEAGLIPSKDEIISQITTGKKGKSDYVTRTEKTPEFEGEIDENIGEYDKQSKEKANKVATDIFTKAKADNKVDELFEEYQKRVNNGSLPESLFGPLGAKIARHYRRTGQNKKLNEAIEFKSKGAEKFSRGLSSVSSTSSPEESVSRVIAELETEKTKAIGGEEGLQQLYDLRAELEANKKEISSVKERMAEEIANLQKKIDNQSKGKSSLDKRIQNRKESVKKVQNKLKKLKRGNDGQLNDISQLIGDTLWNSSIDIINASLDAGMSLQNAIDKAITHIKSKYDGTRFDEKAYKAFIEMQAINEPDVNKSEREIVEQGLKDLDVKVNDIIGTHWTSKEQLGKDLTERLVQEANLPFTEANALSKKIQTAYNEIVAERQIKVLTERLGTSKIPTPKDGKKLPKNRQQQIIEDINKGALTDDMFVNLFADYYGFRKITPEAQAKLNDFVDKIERLSNQPELRQRALIQMQDYMLNKGMEKSLASEILLDMLYTGALSSPNTFINAISGAMHTSFLDIAAEVIANPVSGVVGLKYLFGSAFKNRATFLQVMKDGHSVLEYKDYTPSRGGSGFNSRLTKQKPGEILDELLQEKKDSWVKEGLSKSGTAGKLFYRTMSYMPLRFYWSLLAQDQVVMYGMKDFHSYILAYNEMTSKDKSIRTRLKEANEAIFKHKEEQFTKQAKEDLVQLKKDGDDFGSDFLNNAWIKRRVVELREQNMEETIFKRSIIASKSNLLMNDPQGKAGNIFRGLTFLTNPKETDSKGLATGRLLLNALFLIKRVPANFVDKSLDFFPLYGYYRAIRGTVRTRDEKRKMTPQERRVQLVKASFGMATVAGLGMTLFDWDDEEGLVLDPDSPVKIYGPGYGNYVDNLQISKDFRPWTLQIGDWHIPYQYSPLGATLAPLAMISDDIRLNDFNKVKRDQGYKIERKGVGYAFGVAIAGATSFLTAQSYQMQLRELINGFKALGAGDTEKMKEGFANVASRPVKTIAFPNLYNNVYSTVKTFQDMPEKKKSQFIDYFMDDIPFLENYVDGVMYDQFGYPIVRSLNLPLVKGKLDYREGIPQHDFILKYDQLKTGSFRAPQYIDKIKLDEEMSNEFERLCGLAFREKLDEKYIEKLESKYINVENPNLPLVQKKIDDRRRDALATGRSEWRKKYKEEIRAKEKGLRAKNR